MFDHDISNEEFGFNPLFDEENYINGNMLSINQNTAIDMPSMKPHTEMKYNGSLKTSSNSTRYE